MRARVCSSALVPSAVGVRARTDARRSQGTRALGAPAPRATQGLPERADLLWGGASAAASALLRTHRTHTSLDSHAPDPRDLENFHSTMGRGRHLLQLEGAAGHAAVAAQRGLRGHAALLRGAQVRGARRGLRLRGLRARARALSSAAARLERPGPTGAPVRGGFVVRDAWAAPALQLCWLQAGGLRASAGLWQAQARRANFMH